MLTKEVDPLTFKLIAYIREQGKIAAENYVNRDLGRINRCVELGRCKAFTECLSYYNQLLDEDEGGQNAGNQ